MPSRLTLVRLAIAGLGLTMCVLMFGPFQGLEERLGFSDKAAHGIAFYMLTLGMFASLPRNRRTDLGLAAIGLGALTEVIQSLVGRDGNFADFAADATGIVAAMLPATVERLRLSMRAQPASTATSSSA
jgi:VanZ family protein